jgi:hypothetical protein
MDGIANIGIDILVAEDVDLGVVDLLSLRTGDEAEATGWPKAGDEAKKLLRSLRPRLGARHFSCKYSSPLESQLLDLLCKGRLPRTSLSRLVRDLEKHRVGDL